MQRKKFKYFYVLFVLFAFYLWTCGVSCSNKSNQRNDTNPTVPLTDTKQTDAKRQAYKDAWSKAEESFNKGEEIRTDLDERMQKEVTGTLSHKTSTTTSAPLSASHTTRTDTREERNYDYSFYTSSDVISYLNGIPFINQSNGVTVIFKYEAIYLGKNTTNLYECIAVTGAPVVDYFSGSYADIRASSPYTGGYLRFRVDASRGTLTDKNSGEVYYKR